MLSDRIRTCNSTVYKEYAVFYPFAHSRLRRTKALTAEQTGEFVGKQVLAG